MSEERSGGDAFIEAYIRYRHRLQAAFTVDEDNNIHNTAFYAAVLDTHPGEDGEEVEE